MDKPINSIAGGVGPFLFLLHALNQTGSVCLTESRWNSTGNGNSFMKNNDMGIFEGMSGVVDVINVFEDFAGHFIV